MASKTIEDAFQDIAVFMYGLRWWKDESIRHKIYVEKHFLKFENLKPVWDKMANNYQEKGRAFIHEKDVHEIFEDVVDDMYMYRFGKSIEEALCLSTSEKLKTLRN